MTLTPIIKNINNMFKYIINYFFFYHIKYNMRIFIDLFYILNELKKPISLIFIKNE